ncbi:hypothetical protein ACFWXO_44690 [Kitasatospora sp. NPDC059088]|uniref:hypothetical protein n=1 Tax=Kitasatospora sp. NPDC059088 TaxID=3346722 RepID=UPI0036BBFAA0
MATSITFESLLSGAKDFAHLALDAHAEGQTEVFLLEAGVSVERLAKATLFRVHPTLLSEVKGNDDMLLHFAGATANPPRRLHTIGAATAITRLRKMGVLSKSEELDGLIELRNGVAHLGTSSADDYLEPFVETVSKLLTHTQQDRDEFWGPWAATAQVTLDRRFDRVQKAVLLRILQARSRANSRFGQMPKGTIENVAKAVGEVGLVIVERTPTGVLFRMSRKCPACFTEAAALFLKAPNAALLYEMELITEGLLCSLCGLRLGNEEEIKIAGLPATLVCKVEDLTPAADHDALERGLFPYLVPDHATDHDHDAW